jgi:hypothetical protein
MMYRCYKENCKDYPDYGGRGITVCDRWHDVSKFVEDMGLRPEGRYSIERTDVNGNYEPGNCVWLQMIYQSRNRTDWMHTEEGRNRISESRTGTHRVYADDGSYTYAKSV